MLLNIFIQSESCHSMNNAYYIFKLTLFYGMILSRLMKMRRRKEGFRITFVCSHLIFTTTLTFLLLESSLILTKDSKYQESSSHLPCFCSLRSFSLGFLPYPHSFPIERTFISPSFQMSKNNLKHDFTFKLSN